MASGSVHVIEHIHHPEGSMESAGLEARSWTGTPRRPGWGSGSHAALSGAATTRAADSHSWLSSVLDITTSIPTSITSGGTCSPLPPASGAPTILVARAWRPITLISTPTTAWCPPHVAMPTAPLLSRMKPPPPAGPLNQLHLQRPYLHESHNHRNHSGRDF